MQAAATLRRGELVAFPTETVYGLGADATSDSAVAAIFAAKDRPRFNPLIVHVSDISSARAIGRFNATALRLAEQFWPGPLTLVVSRTPNCPISLLASAGLSSIAIRIPSHPTARRLIEAAGRPLAAPSANRSGTLSPTRAEHVRTSLGKHLAMILDDGPVPLGIESTVISCLEEPPRLLRPGSISGEAAASLLERPLRKGPVSDSPETPIAPGQMLSHYAPNARLRLNVDRPRAEEALLAFGADTPRHEGPMLNLSRTGDLVEAAANLFAMLHDLDKSGVAEIAVMPIPHEGLGEAINDRLARAAAPRPALGTPSPQGIG